MIDTVHVVDPCLLISTQSLECKRTFGNKVCHSIYSIHAVKRGSCARSYFHALNIQFGRTNGIPQWNAQRSRLHVHSIHELHEAKIIWDIETPCVGIFKCKTESGPLYDFHVFERIIKPRRGS